MRKTTLFFMAIAAAVTATFSSCRKAESKYSCDPKIEKFVMLNQQNFAGITRAELCAYAPDTARAIFNAITPQNKMNIWIEKIDLVIDNDSLSQQEITFLQNVKSQFNTNLFGNDSLAVEQLGVYLNAQTDSLNWSEEKKVFILGMPYTKAEFKKYTNEAGSNNCDCRLEGPTWCTHCAVNSCTVVKGCGWIWRQDCTGQCW